jgi:regulator of nonsense transcripts 2
MKYYLFTKDPMPMDIEFLVQDTYALIRPQWKLVTDLSEAANLFSEAVAANYKAQDVEKTAEVEEEAEEVSSDDGIGEDGLPDAEDGQSSSDEAEAEVNKIC